MTLWKMQVVANLGIAPRRPTEGAGSVFVAVIVMYAVYFYEAALTIDNIGG